MVVQWNHHQRAVSPQRQPGVCFVMALTKMKLDQIKCSFIVFSLLLVSGSIYFKSLIQSMMNADLKNIYIILCHKLTANVYYWVWNYFSFRLIHFNTTMKIMLKKQEVIKWWIFNWKNYFKMQTHLRSLFLVLQSNMTNVYPGCVKSAIYA